MNLFGYDLTEKGGVWHYGGSLDLRGTQITALPDNLTVGGYLDLRGTQITALPDNLTVGGSLYLRGTQITALPDNLTVGDYLDLEGTQITALPDNLTVGGYLVLEGTPLEGIDKSKYENKPISPVIYWPNKKFMKVDDLFAEVVNIKGNAWKLKKIGKPNMFFCVTDGHGRYAHGDTIKEAKQDLLYKISGDASKEEFEGLSMDSVLTFEKCIQLYRVITGACAFGVRNFIESNNIEHRSYSVAEVLEKTKGQYGSELLVNFFSHNA